LEQLSLQLWNEFKHNRGVESISKISNHTNDLLDKCKTYFETYYIREDVKTKFLNKSNADRLISEIKKVKSKVNLNPQGSDIDDAWGCIFTNDLYTIHINYYNFFNGKIDANIYDTIVHEMGHIIDFQLRRMNERPSYQEVGFLKPKTDSDKYIISREEDYARVQRLRNILFLPPFATEEEIVDGIKSLIKENKFYFPNLTVEFSEDKLKMLLKGSNPIKNLELNHLSWVLGNLVVNGYLASDLGYLFAKYGQVVQGVIEIDLSKISKINKLFANNSDGKFNNFG
jgi:hypothetical protein